MNYPGVLHDDPEVCAKLAIARELRKPIDGHAPGFAAKQARQYAAAGITTDHECTTLDEAVEKIGYGMKILIREGSAAKNFEALHPLLSSHPDSCMLCTDDSHPDALAAGHIDRLVRRAVAEGHDLFNVLRAGLRESGAVTTDCQLAHCRWATRPISSSCAICKQFELVATYLDGEPVFADGQCRFERAGCPAINRFGAEPLLVDRFQIADRRGQIRVIQAHDGELFTDEIHIEPRRDHGLLISDVERDLLKIAVVNRYAPAPPAIGFIRGFGLKRGAIAASVAHDSHNIVAVGVEDAALSAAVNAVIGNRGGLAVVNGRSIEKLPLEVAGLMSRDGDAVARRYAELDRAARSLGSPLTAPFMTLSFMALLVIPSLKISDRGLFDGKAFEPVSLFL